MTTEVEKGVNDMCNLGEGIYENGLSAGIEKGREEGRINMLLDIVKDGLISVTDAAKKAGMSLDEFESIMKKQK